MPRLCDFRKVSFCFLLDVLVWVQSAGRRSFSLTQHQLQTMPPSLCKLHPGKSSDSVAAMSCAHTFCHCRATCPAWLAAVAVQLLEPRRKAMRKQRCKRGRAPYWRCEWRFFALGPNLTLACIRKEEGCHPPAEVAYRRDGMAEGW